MVGGWTGTCPTGHKKWAWSWLSSKHRKIYLQICREMGSHTVSIMAWEDDRRPSQRSVFGAGSLNLCYCWQESWDENISTKTARTINKISVFCKLIYFDWMSVYVFKYLCFCSTVGLHPSHLFSKLFQDLFHLTDCSSWMQSRLVNWIQMSSKCTASAKINYALYDFNNM